MKNFFLAIIIIVVLAALGFGGWFFFIKKSSEGGGCTNDSRCTQGLKCLNNQCSSGKVGSSCKTYNDCQTGLICQKSLCAVKPDYSKYFGMVSISKMKPGMPPGPNNVPEPTTTFKTTDAIEVDIGGVKSTTVGDFYFELLNSTTGETALTNQTQRLEGHDRGTGTSLDVVKPGDYDFNLYFNNELVYTTPITISK